MASLIGDNGNNYLFGTPDDDTLIGGAGNDSLYGYTGDSLDGGVGEDYLVLNLYYGQTAGFRFDGSASTHLRLADGTTARNGEVFYIIGGSGNDTVIGAAGNDQLYGGEGNDTLDGGAGNDILNGLQGQEISFGGGNDVLNGGAGNDTLEGDTGDSLDGGVGKDYLGLYLSSQTAGFRFDGSVSTHLSLTDGTTARNGEVFNVIGGSGNDTLIGAAGNDYLYGREGNDYLDGGEGNDYLDGGEGNDFLDGGAGNDTFSGREGNDYLDGGEGNDFLDGGAGNDYLDGGEGNDYLDGGYEGNDQLSGGEGNDTLSGLDGNDSLLGGDGNDILVGGAGNDLLVDGGGRDQFIYNTFEAFTRDAVGIDVIQFFSHNYDIIVLDKTTFTTLSSAEGTGFSNLSEFAVVGSNSAAATSTADIVYNSMNGNLFYNPNGSAAGFGTGGQFTTLADNRFLSSTDFMIQA